VGAVQARDEAVGEGAAPGRGSARGRRRPILLIADHKWRDLPGLALLKVLLERDHGVSAVIAPYPQWEEVFFAFRPAAVCTSTMSGPREQEIARRAREAGAATVVLPTEGMPTVDAVMPIVACERVDLSNVDLWLCWNEPVRDRMLARGQLAAEQLPVAGVGRFDFYHEPYRRLLRGREELASQYGFPASGKLVTWATNYGHAKFSAQSLEFHVKDWTERGLTELGPPFDDPAGYVRQDVRDQQLTLEMMPEVFARFPDVTFLVKTHPYEAVEVYEEMIGTCRKNGIENVHHVHYEYIGNLLNVADVHIHHCCTTGQEAWMMGIPTLNLRIPSDHVRPERGGACGEAIVHDDSFSDANEACKRLEHYLNGGAVPEALSAGRARHLERWLHKMDGGATRRIAEALAPLAGRFVSRPDAGDLRRRQRRHLRRSLLRIRANRLLGRPFDEPLPLTREAAARARPSADRPLILDRTVTQSDVRRWVREVERVAR